MVPFFWSTDIRMIGSILGVRVIGQSRKNRVVKDALEN